MSWAERASLRHAIRHRKQARDGEQYTLHQQRVYIFPSMTGFAFAVLIGGLLLGALNYNNNLGYLLTFLLSGLGIAAILHTNRNLAGLVLRAGHAPAVFVGDTARFEVWLVNPSAVPRYSIDLGNTYGSARYDIPAHGESRAELSRPASRRGRLAVGSCMPTTSFPVGLLQSWAHVELTLDCWVYPAPGGDLPLPTPAAETTAQTHATSAGNDDFSGLRPYQPGDSPRRIHWPAWARNEQLLVKHFADSRGTQRWLDWQQLPALADEAKLSQLCRWVLTAEASSSRYGLRLPGVEILPAHGEAHHSHCLEALARYGDSPTSRPG